MTPEERLAELARKAQDDWADAADVVIVHTYDFAHVTKYLYDCNPSTILALIEEKRRLATELRGLRIVIDDIGRQLAVGVTLERPLDRMATAAANLRELAALAEPVKSEEAK